MVRIGMEVGFKWVLNLVTNFWLSRAGGGFERSLFLRKGGLLSDAGPGRGSHEDCCGGLVQEC